MSDNPVNDTKLKEYIEENYGYNPLINFLFESAETTACVLSELDENTPLGSSYENDKFSIEINIDIL